MDLCTPHRRLSRGALGLLLSVGAFAATAGAPTMASAATTSFGSPLAVPATLDTAASLGYAGSNIPTIDPGPPPRPIVVHVGHDGADTALWSQAIPGQAPAAPSAGQITEVRMEGCAQPAAGGPAPNNEVHFQDLVPAADGSVRVDVTTQAFAFPVCGQSTASGAPAGASTVTSFQPTNFCVRAGDYMDFNDEGGFDPQFYPSGVPFQVMGAVDGASTLSFIRNNQTNNGAVFRPGDLTNHDGLVDNPGHELMLQATLATGPDATPLCPGGTSGVKPPTPPAPEPGQPGGPPALVLRPQTDGVNPLRWVGLAVYCARLHGGCTGTVVLLSAGAARAVTLGTGHLTAPARHTVHVRVRLSRSAVALIRRHGRRLPVSMVVRDSGGSSFSQGIVLKI